MKILITGASGFIGSHLTKYLSDTGHLVTAYCRSPQKITALASNDIKIVPGLIEDRDRLRRNIENQDVVIHCALGWGESCVEMLSRDTLPSVALFEDAVALGVKQIIYTSSSVATGEYRLVMDENSVCRPIDAYSATKAATENYLMAISRNTETRFNVVRPTYTFGEPVLPTATCQPDKKFKWMVDRASRDLPISLIKNDGVQMIWVGRLVKLYERLIFGESTRSIVIAGSETQIKWSNIAKKIIKKLKSESEIVLTDEGWSEEGCLWDTKRLSEMVGRDYELEKHLDAHINYLCHQVHTESNQIISGVEA